MKVIVTMSVQNERAAPLLTSLPPPCGAGAGAKKIQPQHHGQTRAPAGNPGPMRDIMGQSEVSQLDRSSAFRACADGTDAGLLVAPL